MVERSAPLYELSEVGRCGAEEGAAREKRSQRHAAPTSRVCTRRASSRRGASELAFTATGSARTVVVSEDVGDRVDDDQPDRRVEAPALDESSRLSRGRGRPRSAASATGSATSPRCSDPQGLVRSRNKAGCQGACLLEHVPQLRRSLDGFLDENALLERLLRVAGQCIV